MLPVELARIGEPLLNVYNNDPTPADTLFARRVVEYARTNPIARQPKYY